MYLTTLLALALLGGVPVGMVALLAAGAAVPWLGLAAVAVLAVPARRRRPAPPGPAVEAQWLAAVASELRVGASLRSALVAAVHRVPGPDLAAVARRAAAGVPLAGLVPALTATLPVTGAVLGPALRMAATSGGEAAAIFLRLSARASAAADEERERRGDTAGARLSAWVVGAVPVTVLAFLLSSGRAEAVMASGAVGAAAVALGVAFQVVGLGAVVVLARRAGRR